MANATVRGCRDILAGTASGRRALISRFAQLCDSYGFSEIETPVLERASVFSRALGATSDIVSSELFHIATRQTGDADGVVLRPEGTAPVLRAIAGCRGKNTLGTYGTRVWYSGPMFRHERPQRLRLRQFTQLGIEIISDNSLTADVDCIALANAFLSETQAGSDAVLRINTLGSQEDRVRYNEALALYLRPPRYGALSPISRARVDADRCLRVLDSKLLEDVDVMRGAPPLEDFICTSEKDRFHMLQERLNEQGISFMVDRTLVRGLDYYTSTAFEFVRKGRAVAAGGRYADVHGLSGVGFAVGLERVEHPEWHQNDATVFSRSLQGGVAVVSIGMENAESIECAVGSVCRRVTRDLRAAGVRTLVRLEGGKLGKHISRAIKAGASAVVMVGENDVARGTVKVKVINHAQTDAEFEQFDVALDEVPSFCRKLVEAPSDAASSPPCKRSTSRDQSSSTTLTTPTQITIKAK